jgi:hypothetical protein
MFCPHCGVQIADDAKTCEACGAEISQQTAQPVQTPAPFAPRTSPMAIWSLVLGILGLITCGIGSVAGFVLGILGLKQCKEKPYEFTGSGLAIAGIVVSCLFAFIGVIACLSALLFPVFARAREAARKSSCQSNMKFMAQALKMYCDDYDGMLPSSALATYPPSVASPANYEKFGCTLGAQFPPRGPRQTWPQVLSDYVRDKDEMWCPSDSTDHTPGPNVVVSYWYKYANDAAWAAGKRKMGDYGYESDQIAFFEYKGWHYGDQSGLKDGFQYNMSYMDTHVESVVLKDGPPIGSPVSTPAGVARSITEPFYYNTKVNAAGTPSHVLGGIDPSHNYDDL